MKVVAFTGYSGAGKTTLIEQVIPRLVARGLCVATIKHTHHGFDIDRPGKDSWRHRAAGAAEVVLASAERTVTLRETPEPNGPDVHRLLAGLAPCDWAIAEGFRHADLPKIEVWRAAAAHPAHYPYDPHIVAVATDDAAALPQTPRQPVLPLNDAGAVVDFLLAHASRHEYHAPRA